MNNNLDNSYSVKRSFKWPLIAMLVAIFSIVNVALYYFYSASYKQSFNHERDNLFSTRVSSFEHFIQENTQKLAHQVEMVALLVSSDQSIDEQHVRDHFGSFWNKLNFDMDAEFMAIFHKSKEEPYFWGEKVVNDPVSQYSELLKKSSVNVRPFSSIDCTANCFQVVSIPLSYGGNVQGTVLIAMSLSNVLYDFSRFSLTDIGLLRTPSKSVDDLKRGHFDILTHRDSLGNITNSYLSETSLNKESKATNIYEKEGSYYDIRIKPLEILESQNGASYVVFIDDVTDAFQNIRQGIIQNVLVSFLGIILASSLMIIMLRKPAKRLGVVAHLLPMLAVERGERLQSILDKMKPLSSGEDEIDVLEKSVRDLAFRLVTLQEEVDQKVEELTSERDFNRLLLESAQVAIVTQSDKGEVVLANDYAKNKLGIGRNDETVTSLGSLFVEDGLSGKYISKISKVFSGEMKNLWHEAQVRCRDGSIRTIVWIHTHLEMISKNIRGSLSVGLDVTERKHAESRLSWLADHDPLTGLYNRRKFHEDFTRIIRQAERYEHDVPLLFFDLDKFKYINDTKGHTAGDRVIKTVAMALKEEVRSTDLVARLGGDEFALVLPEVSLAGAKQVGEKIVQRIASIQIPGVTDGINLSTSIGLAVYPKHGDKVEDLLSNADIAMYQAKSRGSGKVHVFSGSEQVRERIENEMYWENRITRALRKKHFVLYFQPILDISRNKVSHYEVLLRMKSSHGLLFSPSGFISVAEKTKHIRDIDHWVLESAIRELDKYRLNGHDVSFSINLSAHAFSDDTLLPHLESVLETISTPAQNIIFEITETAALEDFPGACDMMYRIKALGCRFALDDFGVGFTSFSYIRDLPVDFIKIDGTFIRELAQSVDDQILVQALATIAVGYGKKTIAEYVENEETLQLLKEYRIDMAQGFYIGQPQDNLLQKDEVQFEELSVVE